MKSEPSLFKRLFVTLSGLLLLLFLLSSLLIYQSISEHLNRAKDAELVGNSHILWDIVKDSLSSDTRAGKIDFNAIPPGLRDEIHKSLSRYSQWQAFRIWKNNTLIFKSGNSESQDTPAAKPDFSEKKRGEDDWRTYAFQEEDIVIEVSENLLSRRILIQSIFKGFLESSVLLLPLLALLLFLSLRFGMRGLTDMEKLLEERGPQSLEHINIDTIAKELKPLQRAINFLLGKLKDNIAHERQLIDNTAHELRTPLATIKLHAQLASDATNEKDRAESMEDLLSTIERTTLLVEQLLTLSHTAVEQVIKKSVSLHAIAAKVLEEHEPEATAKRIQLSLEGDAEEKSLGHEELTGILIGVLLDNAIKYSPDNGAIIIKTSRDKLEISDTGPGIPIEEREKVFERFYRGKHRIQGNGLGLAIAKQICELLDITIELADAPGGSGLLVRLSFPKPQ